MTNNKTFTFSALRQFLIASGLPDDVRVDGHRCDGRFRPVWREYGLSGAMLAIHPWGLHLHHPQDERLNFRCAFEGNPCTCGRFENGGGDA
ncbi:MAG: hypothetical protein EBZ69_05145 [Alphaproteobacteria bacterium]|nr:hypothetical protein [Alphaproteobacteria bacterium]NDC56181.1 hypothetical protein [Alphaproteobacteria bacterium]NDG03108.1 hypothetical protein [Synechococcaceae bacterium WBB_34_004]